MPLSLEAGVGEQVLLHVTVLGAPFGLAGEVVGAERVDGYAVSVHEDVPVGAYREAVGVVKPVGVVECATVGWVAQSVLLAGGVVEAEARRAHVSLESVAVGGDGVGIEELRLCVCLCSELQRVSVRAVAGCERVVLLAVRASRVDGRGGEVLGLQRSASSYEIHVAAHVTAAQNQLSCGVSQR